MLLVSAWGYGKVAQIRGHSGVVMYLDDSLSIEPKPSSTPVTAVTKVTVLDAPFLEVMLPHMLAQAGITFRESIVVVDPRPEFLGKYRSRPRGTRGDLDAILSRLVNRGWVHRVLEVPTERDRIDPVMTRYFGSVGTRVPTHATTGGPVFATLFGLDVATTDYVVVFDADMFFHAAAGSWVQRGLPLFADPSTWLVMTHGGPPMAPMGTLESLGPKNAQRAEWDPQANAFRFKSATTRYFLTDRRRWRGKVPALWRGNDLWPLEQCMSRALRNHGGARLCLAVQGSWDLHGFYHGDPFPAWAPRIAALVEQGRVPTIQCGEYDLRIDRRSFRGAWRALIDTLPITLPVPAQPALRDPQRIEDAHDVKAQPDRGVAMSLAPSPLPMAVVVPVRDRAGARLNNLLASLVWQTPQRPAEIILVSLGSRPEIDHELAALCARWGARLIQHGEPSDPWCKPLATNIGLRHTSETLPFVMLLDGDMIVAPNLLEVVHQELATEPRCLVLCQSFDLPRGCPAPSDPAQLREQLPNLHRQAKIRGRQAPGGIQGATRDFFFSVRGYDEDLKWWGAEDRDMVARAQRAGLSIKWVTASTFMLHQWHPKRHMVLRDANQRRVANAAWIRNHELIQERQTIVRNPDSWGGAK